MIGSSQGQGQGQGSTPCAACKLLRRRCAQECPFSPYFSPHEPQKFACVHKIFGASNVSKMLMEVPENQRADAASSLVYEANARIRDPVYGCMGAISALQQQAQALQAELNAVRQEITRYRQHELSTSAAAAAEVIATTPAAAATSAAPPASYSEQPRPTAAASETGSRPSKQQQQQAVAKVAKSEAYTTSGAASPSSTVATLESKYRGYWSPIS